MFLMGIFWYHLYDMSNYKLCNLDTYNHNFGSSVDPDGNWMNKIYNEAELAEMDGLNYNWLDEA